MEKLQDGQFGKFEGFVLNSPNLIMGGVATGAGEGCIAGVCTSWQSDSRVNGKTTYYTVKDIRKQC
ncbi:hypothetical protein ACS5NO_32835 [Larkinella sp. GY13]|uniref:hypothetical protein n=1 Tax=Larkinella sp. GY13 TaxID=3453720 RepID=UPI003EEE7F26